MNYLWVIPFIKLKNLTETVCVILYTLVQKMERWEDLKNPMDSRASVGGEFYNIISHIYLDKVKESTMNIIFFLIMYFI